MHSFPAQRVAIVPARRTAVVLSLRALYPCSSHERNYKSNRKFLSKWLVKRSQSSASAAACHLTYKIMKDAWRLLKGYISEEIERFC